ncbi:MAG: Zn-dependent hydrolase [Thermomicrobiales bacterium]
MTTVIERWIEPAQVARAIEDLAEFGARGETGVARLVYSPEWSAAQDQVAAWMAEAGLRVERDAVGNVWGYLDGAANGGVLATGSHIDSQNPGGRFDGALGVVGGIAALRVLKERFGQPQRTLAVVSLVEEEASRFAAANFWGSRAIIGKIPADDPRRLRGYDGVTMAEAMRDAGFDPHDIPAARRQDIDAFIELHIEQGPYLEQAGLPVGIVERITGLRHYHVTLEGSANHAGTTPMDLRRDAMAGAAEIISGVINTAHRMGRPVVTTVGRMHVTPNERAVIPHQVTFTVDARSPDPAQRDQLLARHEALMHEVADRRGLGLAIRVDSDRVPVASDPELVAAIAAAVQEAGVPAQRMTSGAVHDAMQLAEIARVAMIFVRSQGGISHSPDEYTSPEDAAAGTEVLARTLYRLGYGS